MKHQQINPLRLDLKGDFGPEVVLHTIVLETVFDLNLKRRKAEEKGDDETEGGIRGGGGRSGRRSSRGGKILSERKWRREKKGGNKSLMRWNYGSDGEGLWWQISNKRIPGEPGSIHHCSSRLKSSRPPSHGDRWRFSADKQPIENEIWHKPPHYGASAALQHG